MKYLLTFIFIFGIVSCTENDEINIEEPMLVVEGSIETGEFPIVYLSTTVPIKKGYQSTSNVNDYIIKWAKVTINDGENEVILTGRYDSDKFPPYSYSTTEMYGETGHTYTLSVEYENYRASAVTAIPAAIVIDSFKIKESGKGEGSRHITAYFKNSDSNKENFQFFTYSTSDRYRSYSASHMGYLSSVTNDSTVKSDVCRGRTIYNWETFKSGFNPGDSVMVKICRLDSISSEYWKRFEEMSILSRNPLFPATKSLVSNVNGALGHWFGYGSAEYLLVMP